MKRTSSFVLFICLCLFLRFVAAVISSLLLLLVLVLLAVKKREITDSVFDRTGGSQGFRDTNTPSHLLINTTGLGPTNL